MHSPVGGCQAAAKHKHPPGHGQHACCLPRGGYTRDNTAKICCKHVPCELSSLVSRWPQDAHVSCRMAPCRWCSHAFTCPAAHAHMWLPAQAIAATCVCIPHALVAVACKCVHAYSCYSIYPYASTEAACWPRQPQVMGMIHPPSKSDEDV